MVVGNLLLIARLLDVVTDLAIAAEDEQPRWLIDVIAERSGGQHARAGRCWSSPTPIELRRGQRGPVRERERGGGPDVDCGDGDHCTDDLCNSGICSNPDNGTCNCQVDGDCDDGNVCTDDLCDPVGGESHTPNVLSCTDNDACADSQCHGG